eukprot:4705632-Pyramimonas_sp.AAC.2
MRPASDWSVVRIYLGALADGHRGGGALPVEHSAAGGREREPAEQAGAAGEVSGVPEGHRADARAPAERHAPAHRARPGMVWALRAIVWTLRAIVWTLRETVCTSRTIVRTLRAIVWTLRAIVWTLRAI